MTIGQKSKIKLKAYGNCKSVKSLHRVYMLLMLSYFDNIIQEMTGLSSIKHLLSENKCYLYSNITTTVGGAPLIAGSKPHCIYHFGAPAALNHMTQVTMVTVWLGEGDQVNKDRGSPQDDWVT